MKQLSILLIVLVCAVVGTMTSFANPVIAQENFCTTDEACPDERCNGKQTDDCPAGKGVNIQYNQNSGACGANRGYCTIVGSQSIELQVPIPGGGNTVRNLEDYIATVFNFLLGASLVVAAAMIALGGYTYLTAAGNQSQISRAKEFIVNAIVALFLVFGSVIFLNFFNPRTAGTNLSINYVPTLNSELRSCPLTAEYSCGAVSDDGNGQCRGRYCTGNNLCLEYSVGSLNDVNTYRCTDPTELEDACNDAPSTGCEEINAAIKSSKLDKYKNKGCGVRDGGCAFGDVFTCASKNAGQQASCNSCEEYRSGNNVFSVSTRGGSVSNVCGEEYNVDTWFFSDWSTKGAVCCKQPNGTYKNVTE